MAQMAAEVLGIPYEHVRVTNDNTDGCPICFGSFGSRVTYYTGNAVVQAANNAKKMMLEVAAEIFGCTSDKLDIVNGKIASPEAPDKAMTMEELSFTALYAKQKFIVGTGSFQRPKSLPDPETGACDPTAALAWGATQVEIEVDTETGVIEVIDSKSVYDVGKAINPALVNGQIVGGAAMGMSWALLENLYPNYPSQKYQARNFGDYIIATAMDFPVIEGRILESASENGPFGAKGMGEMVSNLPAPAIVNAVHDALGIWITDIPITPEKVLRAMDQQEQKNK